MNRRDMMKYFGGAGLLTLVGRVPAFAESAPLRMPACVLTPRQMEGPYYIDAALIRRDITEGRAGAPVRMVLHLVDAESCAPLPNAVIDAWHADAAGMYSGFPGQGDNQNVDTTGQTFLRGTQITDAEGKAEFLTIYPGWYPGRVPHIHIKVHFQNNTYLTSQLYFPEAIHDELFVSREPYSLRGKSSATEATDGVLVSSGGATNLRLTVQEEGNGYLGTLTLGINAPLSEAGAYGDLQPEHYLLDQNYPNPFAQGTAIKFSVPVASDVVIRVYDLLGGERAEIYNASVQAGSHVVQWDGAVRGTRLAPGNYYYQAVVANDRGGFTQARLMTIL